MAINQKQKTKQPSADDLSFQHPIRSWRKTSSAVNERKQQILDGKEPLNDEQYDQGKLKALLVVIVLAGILWLLLYLTQIL